MEADSLGYLSKRERQVMDIIYLLESATTKEVLQRIPDPPSRDAVRTLLRALESKGFIKHKVDGPRHIYSPTLDKVEVSQNLMDHLVKTYFKGSVSLAMAALVKTESQEEFSPRELEAIDLILKEEQKKGN